MLFLASTLAKNRVFLFDAMPFLYFLEINSLTSNFARYNLCGHFPNERVTNNLEKSNNKRTSKGGTIMPNNSKSKKQPVAVFFGCDNNYVKFLSVALASLIANASARRHYEIHILHTDITEENQRTIQAMATENISVAFDNVEADLHHIVDQLPVRDYYSLSTYFRFVIADKFQQYDKAIYVDSDTAIVADIAKLFDINIGNKYVAAVTDAVVSTVPVASAYVSKTLGVPAARYFNAGMIVINSYQWRKHNILGQFVTLVGFYNFAVAQDQDYLNVLCKGKTYPLSKRWNCQCLKKWNIFPQDLGIIHYNFGAKPWHDINCLYGEYFWKYASHSPYYMEIKAEFASVTPEALEFEKTVGGKVIAMCQEELDNKNNFFARISRKKDVRPLLKDQELADLVNRIRFDNF